MIVTRLMRQKLQQSSRLPEPLGETNGTTFLWVCDDQRAMKEIIDSTNPGRWNTRYVIIAIRNMFKMLTGS